MYTNIILLFKTRIISGKTDMSTSWLLFDKSIPILLVLLIKMGNRIADVHFWQSFLEHENKCIACISAKLDIIMPVPTIL